MTRGFSMGIKKYLLVSFLIFTPKIYGKDLLLKFSKTCVAWQARETIALFWDKEPRGVNCQITDTFYKENEEYGILVEIPISHFRSDSEYRDESVKDILGISKQPNISFLSERKKIEDWKGLLEKDEFLLSGLLFINQKSHPLMLKVNKVSFEGIDYLQGVVETSFSYLGVERPSNLWGLALDVNENLSLAFQYRLKKKEEIIKKILASRELETTKREKIMSSNENSRFHKLEAVKLSGENLSFENYKDKVVLIVNIASQCGYTGQLEDLQYLHKNYNHKGLEILAFPSNNFYQEPLEGEEINKFCRLNYGVSFNITRKCDVKGKQIHPVYKHLIENSDPQNKNIRWNFEKFIVNKKGKVIKRFSSSVSPKDKKVTDIIEGLLQ